MVNRELRKCPNLVLLITVFYSIGFILYLQTYRHVRRPPKVKKRIYGRDVENDIQNLLKSLKQVHSIHGLNSGSTSFMDNVYYNLVYADPFTNIFTDRVISQIIRLYVIEIRV